MISVDLQVVQDVDFFDFVILLFLPGFLDFRFIIIVYVYVALHIVVCPISCMPFDSLMQNGLMLIWWTLFIVDDILLTDLAMLSYFPLLIITILIHNYILLQHDTCNPWHAFISYFSMHERFLFISLHFRHYSAHLSSYYHLLRLDSGMRKWWLSLPACLMRNNCWMTDHSIIVRLSPAGTLPPPWRSEGASGGVAVTGGDL